MRCCKLMQILITHTIYCILHCTVFTTAAAQNRRTAHMDLELKHSSSSCKKLLQYIHVNVARVIIQTIGPTKYVNYKYNSSESNKNNFVFVHNGV